MEFYAVVVAFCKILSLGRPGTQALAAVAPIAGRTRARAPGHDNRAPPGPVVSKRKPVKNPEACAAQRQARAADTLQLAEVIAVETVLLNQPRSPYFSFL